MPRAFVLTGGSRSQLGLLEQARALGHEVCVVDGSPDAPLLAEAEHRIVRSFTDVGGVLGDLEAQGIEPVAVATMGSDQAVLPTAQLAERLGLPGLPVETARTVADKRRMRAAFEKRKVRCPKGREAASFEEAEQAFHQLGAPVVVKPVDGSAQRGVTEVRAESELAEAVDRALAASRAGAIVLEQYLDGDEYTVNGFLLEREYFPMSVTRRLLYPPPPARRLHRAPLPLVARERGAAVRAGAQGELGRGARDRALVRAGTDARRPAVGDRGRRTARRRKGRGARQARDRLRRGARKRALGARRAGPRRPAARRADRPGRPGALRGRGAGAHRPARARLPPWRSTASTRRAGTGERG